MSEIINIKDVTQMFGKQTAVHSANLKIKKGEIYGLIGDNGAGKTTLLRIICGLINPTFGKIEYAEELKKNKIGVLISQPGYYGDMTAFENLKSKTYILGYKATKEELNSLLESVGLGNVGKKLVKNFSLGMKQRLGIALALVGKPEILILDEPINGLDPSGIIDVRNLLLKVHAESNITMIVSSHILDELSKIATRICIMNKGKVVAEGAVKELLQENECDTLEDFYLKKVTRNEY